MELREISVLGTRKMLVSNAVQISALESVERFRLSLRTAVRDRELEDHSKAIFFHDADVVMRMISGFRQFKEDREPTTNQRVLLVRALLSSGHLGRVHLLRPHALEVDEKLKAKNDRVSSEMYLDFRRYREEFLEESDIRELVDRLRGVISGAEEGVRVQYFLEELKQMAPESFVALELAQGPWQHRLQRFWKSGILGFAPMDDDIGRRLGDAMVWEMSEMIRPPREDSRRKKAPPGRNTLCDALALAMLHEQVSRRDAGEEVPLVRFHTETKALKESWEKGSKMRTLLSYQRTGTGREDVDFVVRTTDYFVVRASFAALGFGTIVKESAVGGPSLEELQGIVDELEDAVRTGERSLQALQECLDKSRAGRPPLRSYIDEFESLSFLQHIWLTQRPPKELTPLIDGLGEVWDFATTGETGAELRERIQAEGTAALEQIRDGVRDVREWVSQFEDLLIATRETLRISSDGTRVPDLKKDLGSVRWGIEIGDRGEERYKAIFRQLFSSDEEDRWRGCAALTDAIREAESDLEICTIIANILWLFGRWDRVIGAIEKFERRHSGRILGLDLMKAGARMRQGGMTWRDKESLLQALRARVDELEEESRPHFFVGLGYVYFHAWEPEIRRERRPPEEAGEVGVLLRLWLEKALNLGREAVTALPEYQLPWAYAVNHCAYVGTMGKLPVESYVEKMRTLVGRPDLWNYRFADTLAQCLLKKEREIWMQTSGMRRSEGAGATLGRLHEVKSLYDSVERPFVDKEIEEHLQEMRTFELEIRIEIAQEPEAGRVVPGPGGDWVI